MPFSINIRVPKGHKKGLCSIIGVYRKGGSNVSPYRFVIKWEAISGQVATDGDTIKIPLETWNPDKSRVRRTHKQHAHINGILSRVEDRANDIISEIRQTQGKPTVQRFREKWESMHKDSHFFASYEKFVEFKKGQVSISSLTNYQTTLKRLKAFDKVHTINFSGLDQNFVDQYIDWFRSQVSERTGRPWGDSTLLLDFRILKAFLRWALSRGKHTKTYFQYWDIPIQNKSYGKKHYLLPVEIFKLRGLRLEGRSKQARDIFLFLCFTGLRATEYIWLNKDSLNGDVLHYLKAKQRTTSGKSWNKLLLSKHALDFWHRYKSLPDFGINRNTDNYTKVFTGILNDELSQLGEIAGIEKKLTSHVGRTTFATLLSEAGIDISEISKGTGHSAVGITDKYYINEVPVSEAPLKLEEYLKKIG